MAIASNPKLLTQDQAQRKGAKKKFTALQFQKGPKIKEAPASGNRKKKQKTIMSGGQGADFFAAPKERERGGGKKQKKNAVTTIASLSRQVEDRFFFGRLRVVSFPGQ